MEYRTYTDDKAAGRVEIITAGGGVALARKRWDALTGEQQPPEITTVDSVELQARKDSLLSEVEEIDALLADVDSLLS